MGDSSKGSDEVVAKGQSMMELHKSIRRIPEKYYPQDAYDEDTMVISLRRPKQYKGVSDHFKTFVRQAARVMGLRSEHVKGVVGLFRMSGFGSLGADKFSLCVFLRGQKGPHNASPRSYDLGYRDRPS